MSLFFRFALALFVTAMLISGCASTATQPPISTTTISILPTSMPILTTETPAPEQPPSTTIINSGNASQLKKIASPDLPESKLNSIVFAPDNRTMVSGDTSGEVLVWERETWKKTTFLAPQYDAAEQDAFFGTLALISNGKIIVTTNSAGEVIGQDRDGKEVFTFSLGDRVYSTALSPDGKYLAAGGLSKKLIILDLETKQQIADLSSDYEYISALVFSPDGKTLLACYERPGNMIKTWDTATWKETASFSHTSERFDYHDILFTPDGTTLVIASTRKDIEFLDLETHQVVKKLQGHTRAPYQIAFSPDGSLLASASDDMTLRLWDVQTGKAVLVLKNQHEVGTVAFSADGTLLVFGVWEEGIQVWALNEELAPAPVASASGEIAFASDLDGDFEIWLALAPHASAGVNTDGSHLRQLTDNDAMDLSPAWSPDGSRLAFVSNRDGNDEIYTMSADGSDVRRLTETPDFSESFPTWSPDGQFISFDSDRGNNWDVYIANSDGSSSRRLTEHPGEDWISSWSPDGSQIAFESKRDGNYEIYVVNVDGTNPQRLTQNSVQDGAPKWSPDGSKIAFFSHRDGNPEIYVMNADGSNPLRLTNQASEDSFPAWSPDGVWLVFSSGTNQQSEIYLIAADGSQLQKLADTGAQNWTPAWRPTP